MKRLLKTINKINKVSFILLFVFILIMPTLKSQEIIYCRPSPAQHWTGTVRQGPIYKTKRDYDEIKSGKKLLGSYQYRGWAKIDISDIPESAIISSIVLKVNVSKTSDDDHDLKIRKVTSDPVTANASALWDQIGNGTDYSDYHAYDVGNIGGPSDITLNSDAISDLQILVNNNGAWYAIGFWEYDDDANWCEINGWDWNGGNNPDPVLLVEYTLPLPDLIVENQSCDPVSLNSGESMSVFCDVKNQGQGNAGESMLRYYLSDNTTYNNNDDDELGFFYVNPITSGNVISDIEEVINIPLGTTPGTWYVLFYADADIEVPEENETNNIEFVQITITAPIPPVADFEATTPTDITPGATVSFDDLSTGNPNTWVWTFAGGSPGEYNGQNPPNILYNEIGVYNVSLTVTNADGTDTFERENYINVTDESIEFLEVGDLKVYFTGLTEINSSQYIVSGDVHIDYILKFHEDLFVDIDNNIIQGTNLSSDMYLDESTGFTYLPLVVSQFKFEVIGRTLHKYLGGDNKFQLTGLDVPINKVEVFPNENKIVINGDILLPEIMGHILVGIDAITLVYGNIYFDGEIIISDVSIDSTFSLDSLYLSFNTEFNNFRGGAEMEFLNGTGIKIGAVIQNGKLDSIGALVEGLGIPIPNTGFEFINYGGSVFGLASGPLAIYLTTDIKPSGNGSFDIVSLDNLELTYTWATSLKGDGIIVVFNANVADMHMMVRPGIITFNGGLTIIPGLEFVKGDIEATLTKYNDGIDLAGSLDARLQIPENIGWPYGLLGGVVIAETYNYLHNTSLYGNFSFSVLNYHYSLEYRKNETPRMIYDFGRGWEDFDKAIFSMEDLVFNPQLEKINRLEGTSLLISESNPNSLLKILNGEYIQSFSINSPASSLVIRLNVQPYSIVLPDSTIVTPDNFEQIANVDYLVNEEIDKAYYLIKNPQQGMWSVNIENASDTLLLDLFLKSVSPTLQLNETLNLNDSIQISWIDSDVDSDASISLYYDNDNHGANGRRIVKSISENDITDKYFWQTDSIPTGSYYVYGIIDDSINNPTISYSPNPVTIIDINAPESPIELSGNVSDSSIFLNWNYPIIDSTIRFILYYTTDSIKPTFSSSSFNIGNRLTYEFKNFQPGHNYHFMVTAIDTNYLESDHSNILDITFFSNNINNSPDILSQNIPDVVYADSTYSYQLLCTDIDLDDELTYKIYCLSGSDTLTGDNIIEINQSGLISWSPTMNDIGYYSIIINVNDSEGGYDRHTYNLKVLDPTIKNIHINVNNPLYSCFGGSSIVSIKDNTLTNSNDKIDSILFRIYSNADPAGIVLHAVETEPGSDYYRSVFEFSGISSGINKLLVDTTDIIVAEYINSILRDTVTEISYFGFEPLLVNITMTGDTLFCDGDEINVQLTADDDKETYLWSDGITKTSTIDISEPGYYSVMVSNEYGCITLSDTIKVIPLPTPIVELATSDTINICEGSELDPGTCEELCIYDWSTGDTTQTIVINQIGNYNVTVTNEFLCSGYDNVFINQVNRNPIPEFNYLFSVSNIVDFENNSQFGTIYYWDFGDGYSSTIENPSHMYDETGEYAVILQVTNNCGSTTITKTIIVTDVAENELNSNISVYPNPSNNFINIKYRSGEVNEPIEISIIDLSGSILKNIQITNVTGNIESSIDIRDLRKGIYYLKIKGKNTFITRKIVKL